MFIYQVTTITHKSCPLQFYFGKAYPVILLYVQRLAVPGTLCEHNTNGTPAIPSACESQELPNCFGTTIETSDVSDLLVSVTIVLRDTDKSMTYLFPLRA